VVLDLIRTGNKIISKDIIVEIVKELLEKE
jgi:hypothetical protein